MTIAIRSFERKDAPPLEVKVCALRFDGVARCFVVSAFCDGEPREAQSAEMSPWWTSGDSSEMSVMFEKEVQARALVSWLESVAEMG